MVFCCSSSKGKLSQVKIIECKLDKGAYTFGEDISNTISIKNLGESTVVVSNIKISFKNISNPTDSIVYSTTLGKELVLNPKEQQNIKKTVLKDIPKTWEDNAYGFYLSYVVNEEEMSNVYQGFFRVIHDNEITVFNIEIEHNENVPIFKLDGGMSAEYSIEKSAENLTSGISHSWKVNAPGSGPNHVLGTPDFLQNSVSKTVNFYNEVLGEDSTIETLLISSGFPSIPYIANTLNAPVLPLHFLVSVNTVKEIQTILKTANDKGIASYATLSHDPSVPYAVSWIKLLELPQAYKDFIKKHHVKNVVILGATGTSTGETKAKKLLYDSISMDGYANKSIYIMYPGTSPDDVKTLNEKIIDLKDFKQQDDFIRIADWESGINQKQIINFSNDTKSIDQSIAVTTITAEDLGRLYALGGYASLAYMHKNEKKFDGVKGIIFNPYLIAHPNIELKKGFVPLLYWQLVGAQYTVYNMENDLLKVINYYYPDTDSKKLMLWLNSTRNFGAKWSADNLRKELTKKGYTNFIENNYEVDEVWDVLDGEDAPSELLYNDVKNTYGFKKLREWKSSLTPLTIEDIGNLSEIFGGFIVTTN